MSTDSTTGSTAGPDLRAAFHLDDDPTLSRSTVDRREQLRTDPVHVLAGWPNARMVLVDPHGRTPVERRPDSTLVARPVPRNARADSSMVRGSEPYSEYIWPAKTPVRLPRSVAASR